MLEDSLEPSYSRLCISSFEGSYFQHLSHVHSYLSSIFSPSFASLKDRNKWCTKDNQNVRILSSVWHYSMMISVNNSWRSWFLLYRNKYVKGILVLFAPSHIFTSYKVEYFPALIFFASFPLRNFQNHQ